MTQDQITLLKETLDKLYLFAVQVSTFDKKANTAYRQAKNLLTDSKYQSISKEFIFCPSCQLLAEGEGKCNAQGLYTICEYCGTELES